MVTLMNTGGFEGPSVPAVVMLYTPPPFAARQFWTMVFRMMGAAR